MHGRPEKDGKVGLLVLDCCGIYILIADGGTFGTFSAHATVNTHANVFFVFLPGGISKEWRHIVSANCDFKGNLPCQYRVFTGLSGNTWEDQKYLTGVIMTSGASAG